MRSGAMKSLIAHPSLRNSGLEITACSVPDPLSARSAATASPVPTGTVDLIAMTAKWSRYFADLACGGLHRAQIGFAAGALRRAHRNEDHGPPGDRLAHFGRKPQPPGGVVPRDHILQPGLVERAATGIQKRDAGRIAIHATDLVAELGQASAGDQTDIAGSNDADPHAALTAIGAVSTPARDTNGDGRAGQSRPPTPAGHASPLRWSPCACSRHPCRSLNHGDRSRGPDRDRGTKLGAPISCPLFSSDEKPAPLGDDSPSAGPWLAPRRTGPIH
jgi:hypothetical protein